ncbi:Gfo/Idh/MocA family oxidoreductase [Microbacterium jejuense]|uniref:Gfo/Idh/MocA family protein n=1 Tax=Microbacterium jejuense TaxID=1263637 RepID=UPI0031ED712E
MTALGVAVVGGRGYGSLHLRRLQELESAGQVRLLGVADPIRPAGDGDPGDARWFRSLGDLLQEGIRPDIVVIATPPHTHADLAQQAIAAGADVYLEKPPAASFAQFTGLQHAAAAAGRAVQVGFQSLGSEALGIIADLVDGGEIGDIESVAAIGTWARTSAYFRRSAWSGRRELDGEPVVDGAATNPLAHAVVTALHLAGAVHADDVLGVDTDLYRANDIDSDDTSVVRVHTAGGLRVTSALTLCARTQTAPTIVLQGTRGAIELHYTLDEVIVDGPAGHRGFVTTRTGLLRNLIAHRLRGEPLLSGLADSGSFMRVLEAVRVADEPTRIPDSWITWVGEGDDRRAVVHGIERLAARAAHEQATFAELGLAWTPAAIS